MKKIFAVFLSVCLLASLCACGSTNPAQTTENTLPTPTVLVENERILLAMMQESAYTTAMKYKVVTDAENIERIISAINNTPKTLVDESDDIAIKSGQILFRVRLSEGKTVTLYVEGEIYINALYKTDTASIAKELEAIYNATEGEELDWKG